MEAYHRQHRLEITVAVTNHSGEVIVGGKKVLFMDEISTGLDSATTFLITKCLSNFCHILEGTLLVALLQPPPETYNLFDDVMLMSQGHIVFHGPREEVRVMHICIYNKYVYIVFCCNSSCRTGAAKTLHACLLMCVLHKWWMTVMRAFPALDMLIVLLSSAASQPSNPIAK